MCEEGGNKTDSGDQLLEFGNSSPDSFVNIFG